MSPLKEMQDWENRDLPLHVTEEAVTCEGRGQMCRSAWVSVNIIERVHRERSVRGGKTRHFPQKTDGKPTLAAELGRNQNPVPLRF